MPAFLFESLRATATILPSIEYVDERYDEGGAFGVEGMVLIRPPV